MVKVKENRPVMGKIQFLPILDIDISPFRTRACIEFKIPIFIKISFAILHHILCSLALFLRAHLSSFRCTIPTTLLSKSLFFSCWHYLHFLFLFRSNDSWSLYSSSFNCAFCHKRLFTRWCYLLFC